MKNGGISEEDLKFVETYYAWNWKKENNICRASMLTLLRHWPCEVDRAHHWAETHRKEFRKTNPDISGPLKQLKANSGGAMKKGLIGLPPSR